MRSSATSSCSTTTLPSGRISEFWNYVRTMDVPDTLTEKVEIFKDNGQIFLRGGRAVHRDELGGGNDGPGHPHGRAQCDGRKTRGEVDEMEKSIRYLVQQMPGHGDYLARYCPAPIAA